MHTAVKYHDRPERGDNYFIKQMVFCARDLFTSNLFIVF